ncbi:MAG: YlbF family regulator [Firmicutes bacterium]|nr:YlbF family regulator [Bacillota bacterium]
MKNELSEARQRFSQALQATQTYRHYRQLADRLERDPVAIKLLQDLIRFKQITPTEAEQVELDQELQRTGLVLEFLEAERLMIDEYNRLAEEYLGRPAIRCGSGCHGGCSSGCGACK